MKVLALIDVVLDTVGDGLIAEEALGRVIRVAAFTLERAIRFGVEALSGQRLIAEVAHKTRVMIVLVVIERHLLAAIETAATLFAFYVQWVHHLALFLFIYFFFYCSFLSSFFSELSLFIC